MNVTVHEAKTQLSRLLRVAQDGEIVTIVRRGIPVARLTPILPQASTRRLGWETGPVPKSALRAMTDEEAEAFLNGE